MGVLYALSYWADLSQDSKVYRGISIVLADSEFRQLLRPFSSCNGDVHGSGNTYGKSHGNPMCTGIVLKLLMGVATLKEIMQCGWEWHI